MMPMCDFYDCNKSSIFLGAGEQPAFCKEHFELMLRRIHDNYQESVQNAGYKLIRNMPVDDIPNSEKWLKPSDISKRELIVNSKGIDI